MFIAYDDSFLILVTTFFIFFISTVTISYNISSYLQMTTNDDQIIIDQIIEGDTNAFSIIVERYKNLVYTLAMRMLKNREEAEEVSQDTFIKIYKSLIKFKGNSKFSTWVYKVTYNTCLDRIKKHKRTQHVVPIDEFTAHQVKTIDNALFNMEKKEHEKVIQDCLALLPSDDSFLLTLYYFEDQSLEQISKVVGLTANNVKVKVYRSRKKLASILRAKLEPELIENYERERR